MKPDEYKKFIEYCKDFEEGFNPSFRGEGGNNKVFVIVNERIKEKYEKAKALIEFLEKMHEH